MYYEEKIIDGVLCWRNLPEGMWIQKTAEQLTRHLAQIEVKVLAIVTWLESNQPDVFSRGLWDVINANGSES